MQLTVRFNLISKINLLATVLILLTSSGIAAYAIWGENEHMTAAMRAHYRSMSFMIADNCEYGIYTQDVNYLERILNSVALDGNLASISVFDAQFRPLINRNLKPIESSFDFGDELTRQRLEEYFGEAPSVFYVENGGAIEFIIPVFSQGLQGLGDFENPSEKIKRVGYVHAGISKEKIKANRWLFIYRVAAITAVLVAAGGILMQVLGRRIAAPIARISQAAREVADGKLDQRVAVSGETEIGDLARAFNLMLERLRSYRLKVEGYHKELENKVAERTRELEQLVQESKALALKAEAANHSKSEFLANMSHELRTPLNHIIGFTELVTGKDCGDINEIQEEYLNDVLRAGRHLLSLINDILDLSKIEAGKMELDVAEIPIRSLLASSLTMVKEKALKHGIRLSLNIEAAPESLMGDERKLKQVMYNLLSNAVKFTPDGGQIEVGSTIRNGDERPDGPIDGRSLAVWVRDTGIGIEAHDLDVIFAPFEQVESSISRKYQGTGLGLALTSKMVELHGGRIYARSEGKDKGTTFEFTLPICETG